MTMDYSPWSEREIWPLLKRSEISETGEATPTKLGAHVHLMVLMTSSISIGTNDYCCNY